MKRETAYKLAIEALEKQRRKYAPGYFAYLQHGSGYWDWAEKDWKKYIRINQAIYILKDEIDD